MEAALVLSADKAAELGFAGSGPFTFGGAFPGEWLVDHPIELRYLGFATEDEATAAIEAAFTDDGFQPLDLVEVEPGEGKPVRANHAPSLEEARAEQVEEAVEDVAGGKISTHEEANAVAAELGFAFPGDDPKKPLLDEKIAAIEAIRSGGMPEGVVPLGAGDDGVQT